MWQRDASKQRVWMGTNQYRCCCGESTSNPNTSYAYSYTCGDSVRGDNTNANAYSDRNCDTYSYANAFTDSDPNTDSDTYAYRYAQGDTKASSHSASPAVMRLIPS